MNKRLQHITDTLIAESQMGFRKGRSCIDAVFTIKMLIEKRREFNCPTHLAFIDWEKAFDNVNRTLLWEIMLEKGYPKHLVTVITELYADTSVLLSVKGQSEREFVINKGVRQGCPLSPTLFNIYLDELMSTWQQGVDSGVKIGQGRFLNSLMFADDTVIIQESEDKLQMAIHKLQSVSKDFNMVISGQKSKVMAFQGKWPLRSKIVIDNVIMEQVNNFKYLGCEVSFDREHDIPQKIAKFNLICGTIHRTLKGKARKETEIKFYKTMAIPLMTYGSEVWTKTRQDESRIQASEMRFLRSVQGYTRLDQIRNDIIRRQCNVQPLSEIIKKYRINWTNHLLRMSQNRLPIQIWKFKQDGRRDIGRPRKRWTPEQAPEA